MPNLHLPKKVKVKSLLKSRYDQLYSEGMLKSGSRPLDWDQRRSGCDWIADSEGVEYKLLSDGQQSPPVRGSSIMLLGGDADSGYKWTLYSVPRS